MKVGPLQVASPQKGSVIPELVKTATLLVCFCQIYTSVCLISLCNQARKRGSVTPRKGSLLRKSHPSERATPQKGPPLRKGHSSKKATLRKDHPQKGPPLRKGHTSERVTLRNGHPQKLPPSDTATPHKWTPLNKWSLLRNSQLSEMVTPQKWPPHQNPSTHLYI